MCDSVLVSVSLLLCWGVSVCVVTKRVRTKSIFEHLPTEDLLATLPGLGV